MEITDIHPNSPTLQPSAPSVKWHPEVKSFVTDGTASKGEPDTYEILLAYDWAVIEGKICVTGLSYQAPEFGLCCQPDTVEEDCRNHLQHVVFNERIEFV